MGDASVPLNSESLTIQEASKRSGLSEPTLRYYESIGLITAVPRDKSSGHRRYSPSTMEIIEVLSNLRTVGMSIDDMHTYLRLRERGDEAAAERKALFEAHAVELSAEIRRLESRQRYLAAKIAYWDAIMRQDSAAAQEIADNFQQIVAELT